MMTCRGTLVSVVSELTLVWLLCVLFVHVCLHLFTCESFYTGLVLGLWSDSFLICFSFFGRLHSRWQFSTSIADYFPVWIWITARGVTSYSAMYQFRVYVVRSRCFVWVDFLFLKELLCDDNIVQKVLYLFLWESW